MDSLEKLRLNSIYGLLLHNSSDLHSSKNKQIIYSLNNLKEEGIVKKIGCSIYSPDELDFILNSVSVDTSKPH